MDKIIGILKDQLRKEIKSAENNLTASNLDAMYKLLCTIHYMEKDHEDIAPMAESAESIVKKYSNGRYDHNIDALYDAYIEAKKKYKEMGDQGHRDKLMECVCRLMTEVYDMLSCMVSDSDFADERKEIQKHIRRLADA